MINTFIDNHLELVVTFSDDSRLLMSALGDATTLQSIRSLAIDTFSLSENFVLKYKYKEHLITIVCLSLILLFSYSFI